MSNVNDGDTENRAYKIGYYANGYVELQLEHMVAVSKIVIYSGNPGTNRFALKQFKIQGHNGGCYETLPGGSYNQPNDTVRTETLNLATPYVTDRIRLMTDNKNVQIREIEVWGLAATGPRTVTMNCANPGNLTAAPAAGYDYALYLPPGYNSAANINKQYPLIVSLHGLGGKTLNTNHTEVQANPEGFIRQMKKDDMVTNFPAIVIAPHRASIGDSGSGWLNEVVVHKMTLAASREFRVNPDQIIITGLSAGGSTIRTLLIDGYRDTIYAAFIIVAFQAPNQVSQYCNFTKAPIWVLGGTADTIQDVRPWANVKTTHIPNNCGGDTAANIKLTVYDGLGHSDALWDGAYSESEMHNFMLNIRRSYWINGSYVFD